MRGGTLWGAVFPISNSISRGGRRSAIRSTDMGRYYADYIRLMTHVDAVLPGRVHRVSYENMVDNTEAEVRALLDACGLEFEDSCLQFHENARAVRTASSEQVRQPIFRDGTEAWQGFEPWLSPLKAAVGEALTAYPAT
jgi:hypothetical protein